MTTQINWDEFIPKYCEINSRGFSYGMGEPYGQMCVEAAVCTALGLPFGDDPQCVEEAVRSFKIRLNDAPWSTEEARAEGLKLLGIAQVGSLGVVSGKEFYTRMYLKIVTRVLPGYLRKYYSNLYQVEDLPKLFEAVDRLEKITDVLVAQEELLAVHNICWSPATQCLIATKESDVVLARRLAVVFLRCETSAESDTWLRMGADLALETLQELNSPGCAFLSRVA